MITIGFSDYDDHPIAISCRSEEGDEVSLGLSVNAVKTLAASIIHMIDAVERDKEASGETTADYSAVHNAKTVIKKVNGDEFYR